MEVDLLCEDARLALELDGPQYLEVECYRRDRRKEAMLASSAFPLVVPRRITGIVNPRSAGPSALSE